MDLLMQYQPTLSGIDRARTQMITALQKVDLAWDSLTSNELAKNYCFTGKDFPNVKEVGARRALLN